MRENLKRYGLVPGLLQWLITHRHSGTFRFVLLLVCYALVLDAAHWMGYWLRFDFNLPEQYRDQADLIRWWTLTGGLLSLALFSQFTVVVRYFSVPDLERLGLAVACYGAILVGLQALGIQAIWVPRGVILMQVLVTFFGLAGLRLGLRMFRERFAPTPLGERVASKRLGIIGAGDCGVNLVRDLNMRPGLRLLPVAFFDDDLGKRRLRLQGVPVVGPPEEIKKWKRELGIQTVALALPSASPRRVREIVALLQAEGLEYCTVPSVGQLTSGSVRISQLRPVEIEDLLGREEVALEAQAIAEVLRDQVVLVTGAGGSIGSELCRQIQVYRPRRLILVDQAEPQLFQIAHELMEHSGGENCVPRVANILDAPLMRQILGQHRPAVVFHAAAHKHVPLMEGQPREAIRNNALGSARLAGWAIEHGVKRFVLVSTDKAVRPCNVMGATKRLAEMHLQALARSNGGGTRLMAVRFGNVLGSSGSVVPIFQKQIAAGGPVTVTHPEMRRYFMTIPEAAGLVLQSCALGQGGEIFVLDMGKLVKIADLARQMIELSGYRPEEDIAIEFVGLRPGEKLFEELNCHDEHHRPTRHPKIASFIGQPVSLEKLESALAALEQACDVESPEELKQRLQGLVPEYTLGK